MSTVLSPHQVPRSKAHCCLPVTDIGVNSFELYSCPSAFKVSIIYSWDMAEGSFNWWSLTFMDIFSLSLSFFQYEIIWWRRQPLKVLDVIHIYYNRIKDRLVSVWNAAICIFWFTLLIKSRAHLYQFSTFCIGWKVSCIFVLFHSKWIISPF